MKGQCALFWRFDFKYSLLSTGQCISRFTNRKVPYCVKFNPDEDKQNLFVAGMSDKKIVQVKSASDSIQFLSAFYVICNSVFTSCGHSYMKYTSVSPSSASICICVCIAGGFSCSKSLIMGSSRWK